MWSGSLKHNDQTLSGDMKIKDVLFFFLEKCAGLQNPGGNLEDGTSTPG